MRILTLILLLLPTLGLAQQRAAIPPWYVELKGGAVFADADEPADDGSLVALAVGKNVDLKWSVELELIKDSTDFDAGFGMDRESIQFNIVQVNRVPLWNPYFLIGVGAQHFEALGESDTDVLFSVAVGGSWDLSNRGLQLRADARYRYSTLESEIPGILEKGEPVFTLGLVFPLGL